MEELNDALCQEESLWRQKARCDWLKEGERCTKYFHLSTLITRKQNTISQLKGEDEDWLTDQGLLTEAATRFFKQLYTKERCMPYDISSWKFSVLETNSRTTLNRLVVDEEIKRAVFQMSSDKALGPDRFPLTFFQEFWPLVGISFIEFVQWVFHTGIIPGDANALVICLLPKVDQPERLSRFLPISLCDVIVKVVTKVLVNRLQLVMPLLTGPFQSSFVPG